MGTAYDYFDVQHNIEITKAGFLLAWQTLKRQGILRVWKSQGIQELISELHINEIL